MSQMVAHASLEGLVLDLAPQKPVVTTSSCCERAVAEALETTGAMGSTAVVAMLVMGVAMMVVGFVAGLTTAWMMSG